MHSIRLPLQRLALAALLALASSPALAADELNTSTGLTAAGAPLALHGFDPVGYFSAGRPTQGRADLAAVHDGATYYFASQENLDAFEASPGRYAPAFGGFCAFGVSVGKKFDGNPHFWKIEGGRLYLNLNQEIASMFQKDVPGAVAKAEKQWQTIEHTATEQL